MKLRGSLRARPTGLSALGLLLPCRVLLLLPLPLLWFGVEEVVGGGAVTLVVVAAVVDDSMGLQN